MGLLPSTRRLTPSSLPGRSMRSVTRVPSKNDLRAASFWAAAGAADSSSAAAPDAAATRNLQRETEMHIRGSWKTDPLVYRTVGFETYLNLMRSRGPASASRPGREKSSTTPCVRQWAFRTRRRPAPAAWVDRSCPEVASTVTWPPPTDSGRYVRRSELVPGWRVPGKLSVRLSV